ncbi:MAG: LamG-like jellyroll fold domain-containing protein [Bacteroidota bacterium]
MKKLIEKLSIVFLIIFLSAFNKTQAQSNQYLDFDGVNDYVNVPNASTLVAGATGLTITGWFYNTTMGYGQGMMGIRGTGGAFYLIELGSGTIECRFVNSANTLYQVTAPASTIIPNTWQHYAWVYDGSNVKLYLNGTLVGSAAASGSFSSTAVLPFVIGLSPVTGYNFYYKGGIDEITLWNKALTMTEIQHMDTVEPTGNEANLQLYYKFNQGVPGSDNTSITKLINQVSVNSPLYDGDITNFAMMGLTSNFEGTLNNSFQAISFPQVGPKLTTTPPFNLHATATSGLPVSFTIISGPATISNDSVVTVSGAGTVIVKAYQNGNTQYDTAVPVINTFDVVDPMANVPLVEPRHPLSGNVYVGDTLSKIQLAALATINYPSLFTITDLHFKVNGTNIPTHDYGNGHFTAWWLPPSYGTFNIEIDATNNYGATSITNVNVNIMANSLDTTVQAFSGIINNSSVVNEVVVDGQLPSFLGAYDTIIATLTVTCPPGGCGAWDYIRSIKAKSHEGNWFEIIRYITPYGVTCSHSVNLGDYMSILNGKVTFKIVGLDNGYYYALKLTYKSGAPPHKYSQVSEVWNGNYDFGNYSNQQPVGVFNYTFPANVIASKIKLVSTGHGGPSNTSNAAEFYDATHHVYVNGANTFTQHNWTTCNPNPDNCMPQSGTWTYSRAGWCPGSIARPFDFNISPFIGSNNIALKYVFYEQYIDQCNPNYPGCQSGTTCTDCNADVQPYLDVNCNLVNFFDSIPPNPGIQNVTEIKKEFSISVFPNPSNGKFKLESETTPDKPFNVEVYNMAGNIIRQFTWNGQGMYLDLSGYTNGLYLLKVSNSSGVETKKLIVQ